MVLKKLKVRKGYIWLLLFFIIFVLSTLFSLYGDLLWFKSLGYASIFWTILKTRVLLWLIGAVIFYAFIVINLKIATKNSVNKNDQQSLVVNKFVKIISALVAIFVGFWFSSNWGTVLKYLNGVSFNTVEEVFNKDIGFYVFHLPFFSMIQSYLFFLLLVTFIIILLSYLFYSRTKKREIIMEEERLVINYGFSHLNEKSIKHISILGALLSFSMILLFFLARYKVLFSSRGAVFGAAYADLKIFLPLYFILLVLSVAVGLYLLFYKNKNLKRVGASFALLLFVFILGAGINFAVQAFFVEPNEFNIEKEYIIRNIKHTTEAYGLSNIDEEKFPVTYDLDLNDIKNNEATIQNIRLWDWRPLLETYKQVQLFRTYYDFVDVDVDRYMINDQYKQVMVSARELNQEQLPEKAKTWINKHLVYTHGYGVALSPVNEITQEGLPNLYVKDIPPKSVVNSNLEVERPEIYYGQETNDFIIVKTTTQELDYPSGEENIYTTYEGEGGVALDSFMKRLVYSVKFSSLKLLLSGSVQKRTSILFARNIVERASKIAPFLNYDPDPYLVIADKKLYWILDAYTTTDGYPYSEPFERFNYIRNSVKVVVDAYNGDVDFYIIEEEPLVNAYQKIFPSLFKNFDEMPESLQEHIRYPEGLLKIQSNVYATYHMTNPLVFYNKEDEWAIPNEIYRGTSKLIEPYYIIMKIPGNEREEFILISPFTPQGKENMIAWMAARSDSPNYGKMMVFKFSKQELIYGPMQIEARIDQDTDISQKITLWSQRGSDVIRGNLLIIPIEDSILYVEPLYLQASAKGALPQLKRVIVAFGNKVTMKETLEDALNAIFLGEEGLEKIEEEIERLEQAPIIEGEMDYKSLLENIRDHYNKAQQALQEGNFVIYAKEINKVGELLELVA